MLFHLSGNNFIENAHFHFISSHARSVRASLFLRIGYAVRTFTFARIFALHLT